MKNILLTLAAAATIGLGSLALPDTAEAQRRGRGDRDWDGRRFDGDGRDWGRRGTWNRGWGWGRGWNDGFYVRYNPYWNWGYRSYYYPRYYYSYPYARYSYPYYSYYRYPYSSYYSYPYYRYAYGYPYGGIGFSIRF